MARTVIQFDLSQASAEAAKKAIRQFKHDEAKKYKKFVQELANVGISVASANVGNPEYQGLIRFSRHNLKGNLKRAEIYMYATDLQKVMRYWQNRFGIEIAEVSPLLMTEFGSGYDAVAPPSLAGQVGQGTFPGQTHAFDEEGWYWVDLDGVLHHSTGETPSTPMYKAGLAIRDSVLAVARRVFA